MMTMAEAMDEYGWTPSCGNPMEIVVPALGRHYAGDYDRARFCTDIGGPVEIDEDDPYYDAYIEVSGLIDDDAEALIGTLRIPAREFYLRDWGETQESIDKLDAAFRSEYGHLPYLVERGIQFDNAEQRGAFLRLMSTEDPPVLIKELNERYDGDWLKIEKLYPAAHAEIDSIIAELGNLLLK